MDVREKHNTLNSNARLEESHTAGSAGILGCRDHSESSRPGHAVPSPLVPVAVARSQRSTREHRRSMLRGSTGSVNVMGFATIILATQTVITCLLVIMTVTGTETRGHSDYSMTCDPTSPQRKIDANA